MKLRERSERAVAAFVGTLRFSIHTALSLGAAYITLRISMYFLSFTFFHDRSVRGMIAGFVAVVAFLYFMVNRTSAIPRQALFRMAVYICPVLGYFLTYDYFPASPANRFWFAIVGGVVGLAVGSGIGAFLVKWDFEDEPESVESRGALRED